MIRAIGKWKQAAAELACLLEATTHATNEIEVVTTQELDELTNLASVLRALPVDPLVPPAVLGKPGPLSQPNIRPEFRAALRSRLLEEASILPPALRSNRPPPSAAGSAARRGPLLP